MIANVECPQRKMQILPLKKGGLGTPTISGSTANFCTITKNGVGDYTINFVKKPFALVPEVFVTPVTAQVLLRIGTVTNTSAQIRAFQLDGTTPAEADFHFIAVGTLASDLQG
jgi:hypothetical protein